MKNKKKNPNLSSILPNDAGSKNYSTTSFLNSCQIRIKVPEDKKLLHNQVQVNPGKSQSKFMVDNAQSRIIEIQKDNATKVVALSGGSLR